MKTIFFNFGPDLYSYWVINFFVIVYLFILLIHILKWVNLKTQSYSNCYELHHLSRRLRVIGSDHLCPSSICYLFKQYYFEASYRHSLLNIIWRIIVWGCKYTSTNEAARMEPFICISKTMSNNFCQATIWSKTDWGGCQVRKCRYDSEFGQRSTGGKITRY